MTPQMTFAAILFVLAVGFCIRATILHSKAKKTAKEANIKCESAKEEISRLEDMLEASAYQIPNDYPKSFHIGLNDGCGNVFVYANYPNAAGTETMVCIKSFSDEDTDFALLEAQELLDHLNEK